METWYITFGLMILTGIIGAAARIGVQRHSNKTWPHEKLNGFLVALGLGGIGGWITWELGKDRLVAFATGYLFPDIIENLIQGWKPSETPPT